MTYDARSDGERRPEIERTPAQPMKARAVVAPHPKRLRGAASPPALPCGRPELDRILVVMHGEHSCAGRIGQLLKRRGYRLDIRKPRFGSALPETLAEHAGAIVFGGPMSANDPDDYIRREIDWIGVALKEEKPYLGVCLGAQMLARHLGAAVAFHPETRVEIGYYDVMPTEAGRLLGPWPEKVYHWHREGFELPAGSTLLASGHSGFPNQAYAYGRAAIGVQFHPEITYTLVNRWSVVARERLGLTGAQSHVLQMEGHVRYQAAVASWLDAFLGRWLERRVTAG
ncbi:MAG: glutamine amidotransferase [Hyphomicrobiaceae bacterium]